MIMETKSKDMFEPVYEILKIYGWLLSFTTGFICGVILKRVV